MRVLILAQERNHRGALAVSRALAKAGYLVGVGSADPTSIVAASRATHRWHSIPAPTDDLDAFLCATQEAVKDVGYDLILPGGDAETLALSLGRDRIEARLPYPPHEDVVRAFDKLELSRGATKAGLSTPRTVLATEEELRNISGPVVVKARLHWTPGSLGAPLRLPTVISKEREPISRCASEIKDGGGEALLQELIPGRIMHCHAVMDGKGRMITCIKQLSEDLTMPPGGGTRVRSVTVPLEAELADGVASFLKDLGWRGFASLQFIQPLQGKPHLIDFNGRLSLSFQQTIAAEPYLPQLWVLVAAGRDHQEVAQPKVGVRFQWLEGDINRALIQRRGGMLRDLADCLLYARVAVNGVWSKTDHLPALRYWQYYFQRAPHQVRLLRRQSGVVKIEGSEAR